MQPIQYLPQQVIDPMQAAVSGFELGDKIRQQMLARAQAEEQARRQAEADQFISGVMANPNATLEDYAQVLRLKPNLKEPIELVTKRRSEEQNQASLREMGQVYSALTMGRPDVARQLLKRRAEALGNTPGAAEQRSMAQAMIEQLDADPVQVRNGLGVMLAAAPGGKDVVEALGRLGTERRAEDAFPLEQRTREAQAKTAEIGIGKAEAEAERARIQAAFEKRNQEAGLALTSAQTRNALDAISDRARRLNLDAERLAMELADKMGTLPTQRLGDAEKKLANDATLAAVAATGVSNRMLDIADKFAKAGGGYGALSWAVEQVKQGLGIQDTMTAIRGEYARLRNQMAISALPPGVATDKDVQLALQGMPSRFANGGHVASFLRGAAALAQVDADVNSARAEWITANRGLVPARQAMNIGGVQIKPGERFEQAVSRISTEALKRVEAEITAKANRQNSPAGPAVPGAVDPNLFDAADAVLRGGR